LLDLDVVTRNRRAAIPALAILVAAAAVLLAMGRPPICTCGWVALWEPSADSARTSQMLADWYSPSHVIHGLLFYWLLWLVFRRWPIERRFLAALAIETAWELIENTPMVIDRYREATVALGYSGDSVINSLSDIAMMALGFLFARRLPVWASVVLAFTLELAALIVIRDNLTLNIIMLLAPSDAIRAWQAS
jgi:Protein of unknown function (DUF2585)